MENGSLCERVDGRVPTRLCHHRVIGNLRQEVNPSYLAGSGTRSIRQNTAYQNTCEEHPQRRLQVKPEDNNSSSPNGNSGCIVVVSVRVRISRHDTVVGLPDVSVETGVLQTLITTPTPAAGALCVRVCVCVCVCVRVRRCVFVSNPCITILHTSHLE